MKEKIKEASKQFSESQEADVTSAEVVKSIKEGFQRNVKPTWYEWQKDLRISAHGYASVRRSAADS